MGRSISKKMQSIEQSSARKAKKNEDRHKNKRRGEHGCARLKALDAQREAAKNAPQAQQQEVRSGFMGKIRSMFRR